jgi:hypothetical protein
MSDLDLILENDDLSAFKQHVEAEGFDDKFLCMSVEYDSPRIFHHLLECHKTTDIASALTSAIVDGNIKMAKAFLDEPFTTARTRELLVKGRAFDIAVQQEDLPTLDFLLENDCVPFDTWLIEYILGRTEKDSVLCLLVHAPVPFLEELHGLSDDWIRSMADVELRRATAFD